MQTGRPDYPSVALLVAAFVAYVGLGLVFKSLFLNWIIGPLWLFLVLYLLPLLIGRLRGDRPDQARGPA